METLATDLIGLRDGTNVFFVLLGAILVFAMHGGFAFLEVGTVRQKNQVNALVKILGDFAISVTAYFLIGYAIAYGVNFYSDATSLVGDNKGFVPTRMTRLRRHDEMLVVATRACRDETEARITAISRDGRLAGW